MGVTILTLPRLGETMEEARVLDWLKAPGDAFKRGEVLLEVETDKTVVEVPALQDGVLLAHLAASGDTVLLDQPIAEIEIEGSTATALSPKATVSQPASAPPRAAPAATAATARPAASPRARAIARGAGMALASVTGTGRRGRITGTDVTAALRAPANDGAAVETPLGTVALSRVASDGAGTPVLLLHGLFDHGRGWRDLPQRLSRAGHPVLVPDLPGHGASGVEAGDLEEAAAALLAVVPDGKLRIVGHSLGAVLGTWLAGLLEPRVERLVLISPAGLGARINADFIDMMLAADTAPALARALALLGGGPVSDAALRVELDRLRAGRPALARMAAMMARDGIQQVDIAADLARLHVPVTAVFGLQDRIIDWRDCAALPARAAIHLVRDAGHLPHTADPGLVAALVAGQAEPAGTWGVA